MKRSLFFAVMLIALAACTNAKKPSVTRAIASINKIESQNTTTESIATIEEILSDLENKLNKKPTSGEQCHQALEQTFESLFSIRVKTIKEIKLSNEQLKSFLDRSFKARLKIHSMLKLLGMLDSTEKKKCYSSVVDIIQALRYFEDYLIERDHFKSPTNEEFLTLEGKGNYFSVNPKFKNNFQSYKDLKSGDIILSRGNAFASAAIARVSKDDMQFSHISLVYRDQQTNELHTVEAHLEIGNVVAPIQVHLDQKNARTVVFRHPDSFLAHNAARTMYQMVKKAQDKGKNVPYDFKMNYNDHSEIFCSETAHIGFKLASGKKLDVPLYKSNFDPGLSSFLNLLGIPVSKKNIKTKNTFAPGDMQFDPRFEIVAEWRNPKKLRDSRFKDLVLTKVFEWMSKENYQFHFTKAIKAKTALAYTLRRAPDIFENFGVHEDFPLNMPRATLNLFLALDEVAIPLYEHLKDIESYTQGPISPRMALFALEEFKRQDFVTWKERRDAFIIERPFLLKSIFHRYYHPKN